MSEQEPPVDIGIAEKQAADLYENVLADDADIRVRTVSRFSEEFTEKFMKGQREHGGKLTEKDTLTHAWEEVLDLAAYLNATRDKHEAIDIICRSCLNDQRYWRQGFELIRKILNFP